MKMLPISKKLDKSIICVTILCLVFYFTSAYLQPHVYPVVRNTSIVHTEEAVKGLSTKVWLSFDKVAGCEYVGLSWYAGKRDTVFSEVPVFFPEEHDNRIRLKSRPTGSQIVGPWLVQVPHDKFKSQSFSNVKHKCWWSFFNTITEFYP